MSKDTTISKFLLDATAEKIAKECRANPTGDLALAIAHVGSEYAVQQRNQNINVEVAYPHKDILLLYRLTEYRKHTEKEYSSLEYFLTSFGCEVVRALGYGQQEQLSAQQDPAPDVQAQSPLKAGNDGGRKNLSVVQSN